MAVCLKNFGIGAWAARRVIFKDVLSNDRSFVTMSELLDKVADTHIDPYGKFKYILINVLDKASGKSKYIVRGYASAPYHTDILERFTSTLKDLPGLKVECKGGGRIQHDPDEKTILVYGYSQGFGMADHATSVEILKRQYPDYQISMSNEGY